MSDPTKPSIELHVVFDDQLLAVVPLRLPVDKEDVIGDAIRITMRLVSNVDALKALRDTKENFDFIFPVYPEKTMRPRDGLATRTTTFYDSEGEVISREEG